MTMPAEPQAELWPLGLPMPILDEAQSKGTIFLNTGITTLVGPNGSGKTRALRAIQSGLNATNRITMYGRRIQFLAAGRTSPLEAFRASVDGPNYIEHRTAAVGTADFKDQWWNIESIISSLITLDNRADLRLKVEARLRQLFDRGIKLTWANLGLEIEMAPTSGEQPYAANHEASGILHLVGLLAAIHNDEVGALLIDEPELSLHPQHQAFLLEEMERVAGDPADPEKKLIVIATHATSFLPIRSINEIPALVFFNSIREAPTQIASDDGILKRAKLSALISRLSTTHRMAIFAQRVLLVEGSSDEIIVSQLARRLDLRLLARNAQILPVTGKGEFPEAAKLFRMMNKQVAVLADLDALADGSELVLHFSELPEAVTVAAELGHDSLSDLDRGLRNGLATFMARHTKLIEELAHAYPYWSDNAEPAIKTRRVTLALILTAPERFGKELEGHARALRLRYEVLLGGLARLGCFFLRQGAIENYYQHEGGERSKPEAAALEATAFDAMVVEDLQREYADIVGPLENIAPNQRIDEDLLLKPKLGAALSAAFLGMQAETSDPQLNRMARETIGADADIFRLSNCSREELAIRVEIVSPLFKRDTFPFTVTRNDNIISVVSQKLGGLAAGSAL